MFRIYSSNNDGVYDEVDFGQPRLVWDNGDFEVLQFHCVKAARRFLDRLEDPKNELIIGAIDDTSEEEDEFDQGYAFALERIADFVQELQEESF